MEIKNLKDEVKAANTAFEQQKSAYSRLVDHVQPYIDAAIAEEKQETVNVLSVAVEQKQEAAAVLDTDISEKSKKSAKLDKAVEKKQEKLNDLTEKTAVAEKVAVEFEGIEKIGHKRTVIGAVTVSDNMWTKILNLVKEAFNSRKKIKV